MWYDIENELLTSLCQDNATHISDHIHVWGWWCRIIKTHIPYKLLMEWFTKSLLPSITRDVAMAMVTTKDQTISRAQHMDLIYSQSCTLYDIIPNVPRTSTNINKKNPWPHDDGVVGFVSHVSVSQIANQMGQIPIKSHSLSFGTSAQTSIVPS